MRTRIVVAGLLAGCLALLGSASSARAGGFVGFSIGIPLPIPVIPVAPVPVYAPAPCPPPAYYPAPPVYYGPPAYVRDHYYYRGAPAYGPPYGRAWGDHRRHW